MNQTCQVCKGSFNIVDEDINFYQKMGVESPTFCPACRLQRRLSFRNERTFYKRPCELCGKDGISRFDPEKKIVNYCGECWWSDKWDSIEYGQDYDFSRPFFEQFQELMKKVPHQNLIVMYKTLTNSNFTNMNHYLKNCYYIFNSDYNESCLYGEELENCTDCVDMTMADNTQISYESVNCNKCYETYYSVDCESSHDIYFSKNLVGCSNCFGCINLRGQQYNIFNQKYSREEYLEKIKELNDGNYSTIENLKKQAKEFWLQSPNKYMHGVQNLESTGDYVFNSKYVKDSFIVTGSEYCKYSMWLIVKNNKECYDFTQFGENSELVYETLCSGKNINNVIGGINSVEGRNLKYSMYCYNNNSNLFGCVSLKGKEYCILNKQYTKEEYEELLPKIIQHMKDMPYVDKKGRVYTYGDFYPTEISHFSYNETSAQEFFPLSKEEAVEKGFSWDTPKERNHTLDIKTQDLPENISFINEEDIVNKIIECAHKGECKQQCTEAFRITQNEFNFYKAHSIPLPRLCPNCRHYERVKNRNQNNFHIRKCMCDKKHMNHEGECEVEFKTSYAPTDKEIVFCEKCYQQEVY